MFSNSFVSSRVSQVCKLIASVQVTDIVVCVHLKF